ncbi:unnamed protein product [Protopolystoma xenopodis]|uniref:Uncharacterized protein n=1 Tax=Protopolystoma xenopodis TaxID=117903 RepID=A0A448X087_9PLAT|nr:unnamed protein product [Protopolystoma xenopodis]
MASNNMYRVGDFVYFEATASAPYQIRRIEELNKDGLSSSGEHFSNEKLHQVSYICLHLQIEHRELFISRHLETLPATHIRGKCTVTLHNETESCNSYLNKEDAFFFQLVYDPMQKTLQADKGSIRIGQDLTDDPPDPREHLMWRPNTNITTSEIESFLVCARSLATLGRAYNPPAALRQPGLVMSAAAASRDATHQQALNTLHRADYDILRALHLLAPDGQPFLKLDEMEEWSASEGNLFEEALDKYGKCFGDIHSDFLPWKMPKVRNS